MFELAKDYLNNLNLTLQIIREKKKRNYLV